MFAMWRWDFSWGTIEKGEHLLVGDKMTVAILRIKHDSISTNSNKRSNTNNMNQQDKLPIGKHKSKLSKSMFVQNRIHVYVKT